VLQPLERAGVELIAARTLQRRVDSKFVLPARDAIRVIESVGESFAVLPANDELVATYRTLYFDSANLQLFHDHRRGRRVRQKVRIRHYPDREVSFLEIKMRRSGQFTHKVRRERGFGDDQLHADDLVFVKEHLTRPLPDLRATAWINFRRATLMSLHDNERVTVDVDLSVVKGERGESFADLCIIEVKQGRYCSRTPMMRGLLDARFRPRSASKFCTAISVLRPEERMNRLLPNIRAIRRIAT